MSCVSEEVHFSCQRVPVFGVSALAVQIAQSVPDASNIICQDRLVEPRCAKHSTTKRSGKNTASEFAMLNLVAYGPVKRSFLAQSYVSDYSETC